MFLIATRHGETEWNREGREMGHLDSSLTGVGRLQAQALATRLTGSGIAALYSSDLGRAVQTATMIGTACGLEPRFDVRLRERNMGVFQGLTRSEMRERFPHEQGEYERLGFYAQIPKGESVSERTERAVEVFTEIAEQHEGEVVAAVTHGGLLTGFFEHVLGLSPGSGRRFRKDHASYNGFEYDGGLWRLEVWNDTSHFINGSADSVRADDSGGAVSPG